MSNPLFDKGANRDSEKLLLVVDLLGIWIVSSLKAGILLFKHTLLCLGP